MLVHWTTTGRMMAVSGRFSALVNRVRYRDEASIEEEPAPDDLVAAIRAMTAEAFGDAALEAPAPEQTAAKAPARQAPQALWMHVIFFASLAVGGLLSAVLLGTFDAGFSLHGTGFSSTFG